MAHSHSHEHSLEQVRVEVRSLLKQRNMRATASRLAVLVALHEEAGPMTHEQLMEVLPTGGFDKATVWRILADLADNGVLRRMDLGDRIWRYELLDACRSIADDHAHFLCEACGVVSCLPPLEIRAQQGQLPQVLQGADIRVKVTGTCSDCLA